MPLAAQKFDWTGTINVREVSTPTIYIPVLDANGEPADILSTYSAQMTCRITDIHYQDFPYGASSVQRTTWSLNATIDATNEVLRFDLTQEHTGLMPGAYPIEIKLWTSGSGTPPTGTAPEFGERGILQVMERLTTP